ncbi:MAG: hypothetical protein JXR83_07775 [Deltaproteobacteria bacterium]|nr:hypothetical protein [Deltaproteobacteria bacterium]
MPIDDIKFTRSGGRVMVEGRTKPHAEVEVENRSEAPWAPSTFKDDFTAARADAAGRFKVPVRDGAEGDRIHIASRAPGGGALDALSVRIANLDRVDGRRPELAHHCLRLEPAGADSFRLRNVSRRTSMGEPFLEVRFVNARSGEVVKAELDEEGRLPPDVRLRGAAGDRVDLFISDGSHPNSQKVWGYLRVPEERVAGPAMPKMRDDDKLVFGGPRLSEPLKGPLFVGQPRASDCLQGKLGDCYFISAVASMAETHPERIRQLFKEEDDGTVTVTFKAYDHELECYQDVRVNVDRRFYLDRGLPLYGTSSNTAAKLDQMPLWFMLLEKAYAVWSGGYDAIRCGYSFEIWEACLGAEGRMIELADCDADAAWSQIERATRNGDPTICDTNPDCYNGISYNGTGLVPGHSYSLLGAERKGDQRLCRIRNPWGCRGWQNKDTAGEFWMPFEEFLKYYRMVGVGRVTD